MALTGTLLYETEKLTSDPFVLTGPVVGMVTDTTARILIETNVECTAECRLKTTGHNDVIRTIRLEKRIPKCFVFDGLQPEMYYRISLSLPCPGLVKSGFMTTPRRWSLLSSPARMAFVTMNNYMNTRDRVKEKLDLWRSLFKLANKGQIDYLIHTGNNVYQDFEDSKLRSPTELSEDSRWDLAMRELEGVEASEWTNHYDNVCELFRGAYRETWNHPMTKHVLANVPNLMILSDHDIRRSFGDCPNGRDPYSKEFFLCCCAYEVYNQYQRNLFEDYKAQTSPYGCTSEIRQAYHFHVFGDIGVMLLDLRAANTFHRSVSTNTASQEELPLLGHRQWKDIEFSLSDNGYFSGCRMLFVVTPTPPAIIGEAPLKFFQTCRGGAPSKSGSWHSEENVPETSYLLSLVFDWRARNPGQKEFCIMTSGMGQGFTTDIVDVRYTQICDSRLDRAKQIALGPVSDGPPTPASKRLLAQSLGKVNAISPFHQFKHYNVSMDRQFAVVDVYVDFNESHPEFGIVTNFTALVTASDDTQLKTSKPIEAAFRIKGNFKGTFFSMCDPATRNVGARNRNVNDHYALYSTSASEGQHGEKGHEDKSIHDGTYNNLSSPRSFDGALVHGEYRHRTETKSSTLPRRTYQSNNPNSHPQSNSSSSSESSLVASSSYSRYSSVSKVGGASRSSRQKGPNKKQNCGGCSR